MYVYEGPTNALFPQDIIFFCRPRRSCPYETPLFSRGGFYCVALPRGSCAGAQGKHCDQSPELAETTESCGVFSLYLIFPLLDDPELLDFRSFACTSALCMYYFFYLIVTRKSHCIHSIFKLIIQFFSSSIFSSVKNGVVKIKWVGYIKSVKKRASHNSERDECLLAIIVTITVKLLKLSSWLTATVLGFALLIFQ